MGLEIFMGSVWVGSLKRITEIGRDGGMYWMLEMNWFQDKLVLAKFVHKMLVMGTTVCKEQYIYIYIPV